MTTYDAIVVGARCAGAPTAMLLARKGYRVLLCDRAAFPSDTVSNGMFNAPGPRYLRRWGLLERLASTGCPPVFSGVTCVNGREMRADYGPLPTYAPMRSVLDHLLVEAAVEAGAQLREQFRATGVVTEANRVTGVRATLTRDRETVEHARVIVGADGRRSTIARAVGAAQLMREPYGGGGVYSYFEGVEADGYEFHISTTGGGMAILAPSNQGLTHVATFSDDTGPAQARFDRVIAAHPSLAERMTGAKHATRLVAYRNVDVYRRESGGPGWALVGDAGFHQGPISGFGMSHAFRDAELLASAIDTWLSGIHTYDEAMDDYQSNRDEWVVPFGDIAVALLRWKPGETRPSEWPLVQRWLERITEEDKVPA